MDTLIFSAYTVQDAIIAAGIIIALFIVGKFFKKIFKKEKVNPHVQVTTCRHCNWEGQVSQIAGKCPKCNQPLGDQKIKSYQ